MAPAPSGLDLLSNILWIPWYRILTVPWRLLINNLYKNYIFVVDLPACGAITSYASDGARAIQFYFISLFVFAIILFNFLFCSPLHFLLHSYLLYFFSKRTKIHCITVKYNRHLSENQGVKELLNNWLILYWVTLDPCGGWSSRWQCSKFPCLNSRILAILSPIKLSSGFARAGSQICSATSHKNKVTRMGYGAGAVWNELTFRSYGLSNLAAKTHINFAPLMT